MPITIDDLQPYISGTNYGSYTPVASSYVGNLPTSGGQQYSKSSSPFASGTGQGLSFTDPTGMSAIGNMLGIFGSDSSAWKPYKNANNQYVWANPNSRNPVPVANVPGTSLTPSSTYQKLAQQTQAINDLFPYIGSTMNQQNIESAKAQLAASQATQPGYAQLMANMYNTYGPQLNAIGNEITGRNMLAEAKNQNAVLTGPGRDLVRNAQDMARQVDEPFYQTRDMIGKRLNDLTSSIDLSGGLSPTERQEIDKGLALSNSRTGTANAPSQTTAVSNAMQFGNAGYQRTQQSKSNLSAALQTSNAFLPASKSGVDPFQVATGKSSMMNPGQNVFGSIGGANTSGNSQYGLAGNLFGNMTQQDINTQNVDSQKKDWLDKFNQFTSGLGSVVGASSSLATAMKPTPTSSGK